MPLHSDVSSNQNIHDILSRIVATIAAQEGSLLLVDEDERHLRFVVTTSAAADTLRQQRIPIDASITGLAYCFQQSMTVNDVQTHDRFYTHIDDATGMTTSSLMIVPLCVGDQPVGALTAINAANGAFNASDLADFEQAGKAISEHLAAMDEKAPDVGTA